MFFSIIVFLAVLSVLVLCHEFGHYLAARLCGVKADEFAWGFPPRAVGFVRVDGKWKRVKRNDNKVYPNTVWSINWLPLGGFVRLRGEQGNEAVASDSFAAKGVLARFFILVAGVSMNWLLAIVIFSVGFTVGVPAQIDGLPPQAIVSEQKVQLSEVLTGSPAASVGLQPGDYLLAVNGSAFSDVASAQAKLSGSSPKVSLLIEREGKTLIKETTLAYMPELNHVGLGVALSNTGIVRFPWYRAIWQGTVVTWTYTKLIVQAFWSLIKELLTKFHLMADVSGPVGIAVMTGKIAKQGWWQLFQFSAMLSINLAVINFLPIPALDGGRALFVIIETIRRRKANVNFEAGMHKVGFIFLLSLIVLVTFHDVQTYGGAILRTLAHLFQ